MRRCSRIVVLCLCVLFFHFDKFIAHAATVPPGACLYALDPSAGRAFQIAGAQSVTSACGVVVESSATDGFEMEGSETLYLQNHAQVSVVGGAQLNGQTYLRDTISNALVQAVQVTSPGDPLASISAPSTGTIVSASPAHFDMNSRPANNTLQPGVYCGGLTIGNTNGTAFTMSPGVYIMAGGGLTLNSQAVVTGTGVTVYNTSSSGWGCSSSYNYTPVTISGQVTANLSAPTSGALNGILFFGNRTGCATPGSCQDQINGGSTTVLNGALYFKSDQITITGSNATGFTMLVADKIYINGNSTFGDTGDVFDGITVSVTPAVSSLHAGQTQQFTATVSSANPAVTWAISPASTGTITSAGLYTSPSSVTTQQTVTVTATSQADTSKSATATITLLPPVTVSVSPSSATLYGGQTQQLTATVTNSSNTSVVWSITPAGAGTVSAAGLYKAPANVTTQQTVTVTATSQADTSKSASALLTLLPPITVNVSPSSATLYAGQTQQFAASVSNAGNTAVTWTVLGGGTIGAGGLYTAPANVTTQQIVTVTATSQADTTKSASASITLSPPVSVSVSPATATLYGNQTQQFVATVENSTDTIVTWTVSPTGSGTISASGSYTAPASIATQQTVTITATSQADPTKSATAMVTLSPPVVVSVSPAMATLYANQTQQFSASVTNSINTAVTWSLSGAGTVNAAGLYTAPASVVAQQTTTVTATSQADPTKSATALVTLSPAVTVNVNPATATLHATQTQQLIATVSNTANSAVTWTTSGPGTVSPMGLYTAPATVTTQQVVTVTATSQADTTASGSAAVTLSPPIGVSVNPSAASLRASQTQRFSANVTNTNNTTVTWTVSGPGTIDSGGLYTAPASVSVQQTATITATSQADTTASASATVALLPAVTVSISPTTSALSAGQTQQFIANVTNTSNTSVTWAVIGAGTIDSTGLYTAPVSISAQQTVTVTATTQDGSNQSASAIATLLATQCVANPYSYRRILTVDHTKVPNTDQTDYPMLVSGNYPFLASIANGGQVQNPNGYDIIFTSDPQGLNLLDFEIDSYNSLTGTAAFWVRVPLLSHLRDTTIYMWYGNSAITVTQENKAGVWKNNYLSVYHLGNGSAVGVMDSGSARYDLSGSAPPAPGAIGGGIVLNGNSQAFLFHAAVPAYPSGDQPVTLETWEQVAPAGNTGDIFGYGENSGTGSRIALSANTSNVVMEFERIGTSSTTAGGSGWHHLVGVYFGGAVSPTTNQLYFDGVPLPPLTTGGQAAITTAELRIGGIPTVSGCCGFNGSIDEVRISSGIRSADWISMEYNNESSPSTFYNLSAANAIVIEPVTSDLNNSQSLQFTAVPESGCTEAVTWTQSPSGLGTLTPTGLYTAPSSITSQQVVTITATDQVDPPQIGTANVTLLPLSTTSSIVLNANAPSPYEAGTSQGFTASLRDQNGIPESGVSVSFTVTGVNARTFTAITNVTGSVGFSYTGTASGVDTIQASAAIGGQAVSSNALSILWTGQATSDGQGSITLSPSGLPPTLNLEGLCGAFTDSNGNVVEPVAIGAAAKVFIVPAGATQLQLGIDDGAFHDNFGPGFVVNVNGSAVLVPAGAMPWTWAVGGQNSSYVFGLQDGTSPIVAATNLTPGEDVVVAYQSGLNSPGGFFQPVYNADGVPGQLTGVTPSTSGVNAPTAYMGALSYTVGESLPFRAQVTDSTGTPVSNVPVTFSVVGVNAQQFQTVTDSSGIAAFTYIGGSAGTDNVHAQASQSGNTTLTSGQTTVLWQNLASQSPSATLALTPTVTQSMVVGGQQTFTVLAADLLGNPLSGVNVTFVATSSTYVYLTGTTDAAGHVTFRYTSATPGAATVRTVASINGTVTYSNVVSVDWLGALPPPPGPAGAIAISVSAQPTVTLPDPLQLNGTVTDSNLPGASPLVEAWTQVSGSGTASFANPQAASTTASFSQPGTYVLQLTASDSITSASEQIQVAVSPAPGTQGWIGSPAYGASVSGIVPITVAPGVALQSGTLTYYSANDLNGVHVVTLNGDTSGAGQIGALDTTLLPNGAYWIQLQATDTRGESQYSFSLITVVGGYKPGRVTTTVTDLIVPATGLAINIQRQYDSLNAATSGDFGFGWNLSTNVDLTVDPAYNVTFTLGGQRRTFYFAPAPAGFPFPWSYAAFTPEPGLNGTLVGSGQGCPLDIVQPNGSLWFCVDGSPYNPSGYVYTDPSGTQYAISSNGALQSIEDIGGNGLTITPNGITSSTGLSVPFIRDSSGRITKITDPQGNNYLYTYDTDGNLSTVTYPGIPQPNSYTYAASHLYAGGTDFRGNPLPTTGYYPDGRIQSVTDSLGETTSYVYDLAANTTTTTYPPDANGSVGSSQSTFDSYGMLLKSTDPLGHTTSNVYDPNHKLISVTDPLGNVNSYTYDSNGNRTSATYPKTGLGINTTSTTTYNQYSEPTSTTDELGNVRTFTYDSSFQPLSITDTINGTPATLVSFTFNANGTLQAGAIGYDISAQPGRASQYAYDVYGNLNAKTDALGRTTSYTYDTLGRKLTMTEPLPNANISAAVATTTYSYDTLGHLVQTAAPLGRTTSSTYDANGNKLSDTDALGHITTYQYDSLNRLTTTTYPTTPATTTTKTYDFRNNVIDETDQAGHVTHHVYDVAGRPVSVTNGFGTSTASTNTTTYYDDGRKQSETDTLGHFTTYTYDAAGRLITIAGVKGNTGYAYNAAGNRTSTTDGDGNTTQFQHDPRKRLIQTIYPDATTTTNSYDGPGNLIAVIDQAGNTVRYNYDAANQLQSVVQTNSPNTSNNTTVYSYDNNGNLASVTDPNGHSTINAYDLLSELTDKTIPDGTVTEKRGYDFSGNLLSLQHFNGKTTTYAYDPLNRLTSRTPDPSLNEATVTFTYTATGKHASTTDSSGTTTYAYDALDRLTAKMTPEGTINYTYDAAGNVASIASSNANGASVAYTYDSLNRLSTVVDNRLPSGQNTTGYSYDTASNLVTATYPNGLQSTFHYDQLNRLTSMTTPTSGYLYQLGPAGNRTSVTELTGRTLNWSYDGIYRLTSEVISQDPSGKSGSVGYSLDPVGNRLSTSSTLLGIDSSAASYSLDDWMSTETYDTNGNVLTTGGKLFAYDSENRLATMNGGAVKIVYDGFGNRVAETKNGVTTHYLVEDDVNPTGLPQVLEEIVGSVVQREYTYGLQRISQEQIVDSAWTSSFYGYDGAGTVRQLTNFAGAVTDTYSYDAFGNLIDSAGTTPNNYLYRGEQFDSNLGLYYLRHRYYNPLSGRFLSRDSNDGNPALPKTLHKYIYASGDPVDRIDPRGQEDEVETEAFDAQNLTHDTKYAARQLGVTDKILRAAVETLKQANRFPGNPDVWIDVTNGNVYLEAIEDEEITYDFLDNLYDYIP